MYLHTQLHTEPRTDARRPARLDGVASAVQRRSSVDLQRRR